jgi:hypothetical protein
MRYRERIVFFSVLWELKLWRDVEEGKEKFKDQQKIAETGKFIPNIIKTHNFVDENNWGPEWERSQSNSCSSASLQLVLVFSP